MTGPTLPPDVVPTNDTLSQLTALAGFLGADATFPGLLSAMRETGRAVNEQLEKVRAEAAKLADDREAHRVALEQHAAALAAFEDRNRSLATWSAGVEARERSVAAAEARVKALDELQKALEAERAEVARLREDLAGRLEQLKKIAGS